MKGWMRDSMRQYSFLDEYLPETRSIWPCTKVHTWKETFYKTLTTECDGMTRLLSTQEIQRSTTSVYDNNDVSACRAILETLDNPFWNYPPFPTCIIPEDQCEAQWNQLMSAFKDWWVHRGQITWLGYRPGRVEHSENEILTCHPDDPNFDSDMCFDIEKWLYERNYLTGRGWFSGCPQAQKYCWNSEDQLLGQSEHPDDEVHGGWSGSGGCEVRVNRFVLIHFPPLEMTGTRDICAINNFNPSIGFSDLNATSIVTADLSSVVFAAQDLRTIGWNVKPFTGSFRVPVPEMCKLCKLLNSGLC
jgi:hypothetical protein